MSTRALVFNFDGTMASTFEPSADGVSTQGAYEYAIEKVFGKSQLDQYRRRGGLNNRPPAQVVLDLGVPAAEAREFTDQLVRHKLEYLVPEIGRPAADGGMWPTLSPGFTDFWRAAQLMAGRGELAIAGVGSGHRAFIDRTFEIYHLDEPVFITDEDIRAHADYSYAGGHKTDTLRFNLAARQLGLRAAQDLVYVGDDPQVDGIMARRAGVPFIHFDPSVGLQVIHEDEPDVVVFHAGTKLDQDDLLTSGGRVFGVSVTGRNLREAKSNAYAAVRRISFEGSQYRTDIGDKSLDQ